MHIKINQFRLWNQYVDECLPAIEEYVAMVKAKEPGVLAYASYRQPDGVSFTEVIAFKDGKAEVDHRDTEHGRKLRDSILPCCEVEPQFTSGDLVAST